jgi:riboflavin kinase/FMN adenylyltransferase
LTIYRSPSELPIFRNAVITIGSFDGVHFGHQRILRRITELAKQYNGESVVITFDPHPRLVVYPDDDSLHLLTSTPEKCRLLEAAGVNHVVLVRFTTEFSQQSPEDYIQHFLVKNFQPNYIVIGYDHHFGESRKGNIHLLQALSLKYGYTVEEINRQEVEDIAVSSTKIRLALDVGNIETATQLLNHPFTISGTVVQGLQVGRTINYPTANIAPDDRHQLIPANGIYAVWVTVMNKQYAGSLYIGNRPTLNGTTRSIEVFIFDFDSDIYGQNISLVFVKYIRADKKLNGLDELKQQIAADNEAVADVLLGSENRAFSNL